MSAPFAGGSSQPSPGPWSSATAAFSHQNQSAHSDVLSRQAPLDRRAPIDLSTTSYPQNSSSQYKTPTYDALNPQRNLQPEEQSDSRRPSASRLCAKCGNPLSGQFVRALDTTFHLECFTCHECGKIVASKFFPVPDEGPAQYPLCETDYFRRLDLICFACGNALRGSYITALDRKYHIEHFTCSVCPTVFGAQDSYYEHDGNVYCHYHYSTRFAQRCHGCHNAILKQFVEIFRNGQNQHWHPECYMIHKYWNVRLHNPDQSDPNAGATAEKEDATEEERRVVRDSEEEIEEKVLWIWKSLSAFEERAATCISDMLLHVSNGQYFDGIMAARKFIIHVELFFDCTDGLDQRMLVETSKGLAYGREAKLLCKKIVSFFALLSESQTAGMQRLGVTQELLSLVTGLAHYLKLLIRICLQGALKLERDTGKSDGLKDFLEKINTLDERLAVSEVRDPLKETAPFVHRTSDSCPVCDKPVEDKCVRKNDRVFHLSCLVCRRCGLDLKDNLADIRYSPSTREILCRNDAMHVPDAEGGFIPVTRLQQYVHLLKVAHARLLATLQNSGAIKIATDTGNQSSLGNRRESTTYEQTLGDIRRLRSTRMDKQLGNTMKRARSSRIIDGPGGVTALPGAEAQGPENVHQEQKNLQIVHDRNPDADPEFMFGMQQMALDDIPRIVKAEVTKEIRPNAAKYAGNNLVSSEPRAKFINGHRRSMSGANELDKYAVGSPRQRRFFGELTPLEYIIARTMAVLYLEPLLESQFTHQELIELVETKRPTFWGRFNKAFKNDKNSGKKKGAFGRNLEQVVERDGAESTDGVGPGALRVPAIIESTVTAMRNMDMSVEGVFRKNGNMRRLKEQVELIDNQGCEAVDLTKEQPVQVAVLLKKFLRDMPEPLLTFKLYKLFITAAKIPDEQKRQRVLHLTCCLLPKTNRDTMEILFTFLSWASSFHTVDEESGSKMDIHNLATVIAPNVLHGGPKVPDVEGSFLAVEAVHTLIEYNESMCEVPLEIVSILNQSNYDDKAEPTTKDIIKRYGDLVRQPTTSTSSPLQSHGQQYSLGRTGTLQHSDPSTWPTEPSSVRPMGGSGYATPMMMGTPPQIHPPEPSGSPGPRQNHFRGNGYPANTGNQLGITGTG